MTITALEKKLKNQELESIYLLYGKETYLLENSLKKIKNLFGELKDGLNYIKIDDSNTKMLITELQTPPFGFEKKLIIVRDTDLLKKQGKKKNIAVQDEIKKIVSYMENNLEEIKMQNVIIFVEDDIEKNDLYKFIDGAGIICNFEQEKIPELAKRIKFICSSYNVEIDNYTMNYFIETCGTNLQDLINEIRKLIEYEGAGGTIKKEDIDALCIKQFESVIFDLTDSLGQKNVSKALDVLKNLIYAKEPIQKILITLYNHFKKIYVVKLCERYNCDVGQNLRLKANQMFLISKYKKQAGFFTEAGIRNLLLQLINLDENYKCGNIDLNIGLETIICTYCSK